MMGVICDSELIEKALAARENAYAPYSDFLVGAAVLFDSGNVYVGCNVENSSFGATNCAERTAIFAAIAAGEIRRGGKIAKIVIAGGKKQKKLDFCPPCGICLQVISEFARNIIKCEVVLVKTILKDDQHQVVETAAYNLSELLPLGFDLK